MTDMQCTDYFDRLHYFIDVILYNIFYYQLGWPFTELTAASFVRHMYWVNFLVPLKNQL